MKSQYRRPSLRQAIAWTALLSSIALYGTGSEKAEAESNQESERPHRAVIVESFSRVKDESGAG